MCIDSLCNIGGGHLQTKTDYMPKQIKETFILFLYPQYGSSLKIFAYGLLKHKGLKLSIT